MGKDFYFPGYSRRSGGSCPHSNGDFCVIYFAVGEFFAAIKKGFKDGEILGESIAPPKPSPKRRAKKKN
jgi:hypothetical protein